jgi:hypothetical protein
LVSKLVSASASSRICPGILVGCLFVPPLFQSSSLVDHDILLKKLTLYKFDEETVQWFKSYLSGRSHSVQVEAYQSPAEDPEDHAAP